MIEPDETQAIRGLGVAIQQMRRRGFGKLEAFILAGIIIVLIAAFLSIWYVIGQQLKQAERDRRASEERQKTEQIATDVRANLEELRRALAAGPEAQARAIQKLLDGIEVLLNRQTQVIIREEGKRETVVVYVTPSPQPTATVTCDPRPVLSRRPC